jgi:hypothetical protein
VPGKAQKAPQLLVPDRRGGGSDSRGEELEKAAQSAVVQQGGSFDHGRGSFAVPWLEHPGEAVCEISR